MHGLQLLACALEECLGPGDAGCREDVILGGRSCVPGCPCAFDAGDLCDGGAMRVLMLEVRVGQIGQTLDVDRCASCRVPVNGDVLQLVFPSLRSAGCPADRYWFPAATPEGWLRGWRLPGPTREGRRLPGSRVAGSRSGPVRVRGCCDASGPFGPWSPQRAARTGVLRTGHSGPQGRAADG